MSENLTPAATLASSVLLLTEVFSTQYALPSKPNLKEIAQRLRKIMQTVPIQEPLDRHIYIPDTFKEFCSETVEKKTTSVFFVMPA